MVKIIDVEPHTMQEALWRWYMRTRELAGVPVKKIEVKHISTIDVRVVKKIVVKGGDE